MFDSCFNLITYFKASMTITTSKSDTQGRQQTRYIKQL